MSDANVKLDDWLAVSIGRPCFALTVDAGFLDSGAERWLAKWRSTPSFVYAKIAPNDASAIRFLQDAGFYLVDTAVTFHKTITSEVWSPDADRSHQVRVATPDDMAGTIDVARKNFGQSRFHLDPSVPAEVADDLRARWVENFYKGKRGEAMVLALDGERVIGFNQLLLRGDVYVIDLISVDSAYRKRGIAGDLVRFGDHHFAGATKARVSTQVANIGACRLYERLGFMLESAKYVFHLHT
jgi:ribosomal protein S18 acetylase RimI-like enzyme